MFGLQLWFQEHNTRIQRRLPGCQNRANEMICAVHIKTPAHTNAGIHKHKCSFRATHKWDFLIPRDGSDLSYVQRTDWVIRCEKSLKLQSFFFCPACPLSPPFFSYHPTSSTLSSIPDSLTLHNSCPPSHCWVNTSLWVCTTGPQDRGCFCTCAHMCKHTLHVCLSF